MAIKPSEIDKEGKIIFGWINKLINLGKKYKTSTIIILILACIIGFLYFHTEESLHAFHQLNVEVSTLNDNLEAAKESSDEADALIIQGIAPLYRDHLSELHDKYVERGWCSAVEKDAYQEDFNNYVEAGFNHVAQSWLSDVLALPNEPR